MAIGIIVAIILLALIGGFCVAAYRNLGDRRHEGNPLKVGIYGILAIVLVLAFLIVPFSFHTISTGEIAVVKHLGKITGTRTAGTHFDLWLTNVYKKYDTKVQNLEITTAAYSSDAQTMDIFMTIQYQIIGDEVVDIATQYGSLKTLENRISSIAIEKTKAVLSSYKAMDIIANRAQISPEVEVAIKDAIGEEYYVNVTTVVLTNIDFSDAFELAVEEKMIAEQSKLKADYENQTKIAKAEADAQAELKEAEAKIEIAKAEAEARQIAADAEASANRTVNASLTDEILQKAFIDAWNGELPVVTGSDGNYILPADILE